MRFLLASLLWAVGAVVILLISSDGAVSCDGGWSSIVQWVL